MMTNKLKKIYDIIVKNDFLISFSALFIFKKRINTVVLNSILVLIIIAFITVYVVRLLDPYNNK